LIPIQKYFQQAAKESAFSINFFHTNSGCVNVLARLSLDTEKWYISHADAIPLLNQHGQSSKEVAIFSNTMGCSSSTPTDMAS